MTVTIMPLTPVVAGEVRAIDLRQVHDRESLEAIRASMDEYVWRPHDFAIWDNRCTMHRARPFDGKTHRRELRRATSLDLPLRGSA